jgi:acyl-CoA synthetase (AMP-forming)/AMP-acid ligase II
MNENGHRKSVSLPEDGLALGQILLRRLDEEPDAVACQLVGNNGDVDIVTVRQLMDRAKAFALRYGPAAGGRKIVAVCIYHGRDLHAAFVGALLAGHIPTMVAPPSPRMDAAKYTNSFGRMLNHIRPDFVVADSSALEKLDALALKRFPESELIDAALVSASTNFDPWEGHAEDVAVLQHSSGTTGLQKGVALSHRAIIKHNRAYAERLKLTHDDVIVSWLPLYHDMGFIACFLLPLLARVAFVELSPFDWVLRPVSLLQQIALHRATFCWMPNFAFQFMAESISPHQIPAGLRLDSIRAWVNCSEPVQHEAHEAFLKRFGEYGAKPEQFTASYAMAENVFAVSQSLPGEGRVLPVNRREFSFERIELDTTAAALTFVSNGKVLEGTELAVIDEAEQLLPPKRVGELVIRGDYRFAGYFRRDDLTEESLTEGGWYKTGDLGFIHDGEVYVTGRKKDLIIIQGRNFYPSDIEKIVAEVEGVIAGRLVVFGLRNEQKGTEGLIILAESEQHESDAARRLALRIRNVVAQELDCTPQDVRIVPSRWLIKSTAGKLARNDNRNKYQEEFMKEKRGSLVYV